MAKPKGRDAAGTAKKGPAKGLLKSLVDRVSGGAKKALAKPTKAAPAKVAAKPSVKPAAKVAPAKAPTKVSATKVKVPATKPATKTKAPAAKAATKAPPAKVQARGAAPKPGAPAAKAPSSRAAGRPVAGLGKEKPKAAPPPARVELEVPARPPQPMPRASKLPPLEQPLTKREMEQLLTAGEGRGVVGEGSLKGRLVVKESFPYLHVVGRDKRELTFLLQGPDQEVLPAYMDHKVSVSGLIRKTTNYGGTVDVRKYSAKKPEAEVVEAQPETKLRFLSPGEVEQLCSTGMGAGMTGFATIRGSLEMTGEEFILVVSHGGTRQQVSFVLHGKNTKGMRKHLGHTLQVSGVVEKTSGWGGRLEVDNFEPRAREFRGISRDGLQTAEFEGGKGAGASEPIEVKLNCGLSIRLVERPGYTWAVEPAVAKRLGLREANFEPSNAGATREFFFTPRTPGQVDAEFFLAKALSPAQVARTYKLSVVVRP